jgi:predicted DNA-binding transcriptional regulator YafY
VSATAADHLNRVVQLVADISRDPAAGSAGVSMQDIAARLGTTPAQVQKDLRTLTAISDDSSAEWLQSLSVWQEGDRVSAVSRGPYRRPLRFLPDELLAIRVGLALEGDEGEALARELARALEEDHAEGAVQVMGPGAGEAGVVAMARIAMDRSRPLAIKYAGERSRHGGDRVIEPHQVASADGRHYIVAWCREKMDWRHFRADRVIDIMPADGTFTPRADFVPLDSPAEVFRHDAAGDAVTVRYSPAVARWLGERFPEARRVDGGAVEVTYRVAEPTWLVRMVLQYGAEAEIVAPEAYRDAMRASLVER